MHAQNAFPFHGSIPFWCVLEQDSSLQTALPLYSWPLTSVLQRTAKKKRHYFLIQWSIKKAHNPGINPHIAFLWQQHCLGLNLSNDFWGRSFYLDHYEFELNEFVYCMLIYCGNNALSRHREMYSWSLRIKAAKRFSFARDDNMLNRFLPLLNSWKIQPLPLMYMHSNDVILSCLKGTALMMIVP